MKKNSADLTPRERIEAALSLHQLEAPDTPISVAAICANASVSRANLYERHPDLVNRIRGSSKERVVRSKGRDTFAALQKELASEKKKVAALQYLCVELYAEIQRLHARASLDAAPPIDRHRR